MLRDLLPGLHFASSLARPTSKGKAEHKPITIASEMPELSPGILRFTPSNLIAHQIKGILKHTPSENQKNSAPQISNDLEVKSEIKKKVNFPKKFPSTEMTHNPRVGKLDPKKEARRFRHRPCAAQNANDRARELTQEVYGIEDAKTMNPPMIKAPR